MSDLITVSNVLTSGWSAAFRGMRNSRQSWDKSDSIFEEEQRNLQVGENDLALASRLAAYGGSHAKFRRMIHVSMDIYAPLYWWKEFDTYKVGTTANSTSTMYCITNKEFELADFAIDPGNYKLTDEMKANKSKLTKEDFVGLERQVHPEVVKHWNNTINVLNILREKYINETDFPEKYLYWREIIQLLPESYKQLRTVDMNYEVISKIYKDRLHHKLKEWNIFIDQIIELPLANELIFCKE